MKRKLKYLKTVNRRPTDNQLRKKLVKVFNKFIRLRDKDKGCISCGGPVQQAGHYWSTSQCPQPAMRFCEKNVHGQCINCNHFLEGNRQGYMKGLIKRYGENILEALDVKRSIRQNPWSLWEYESMIGIYKGRICEMVDNKPIVSYNADMGSKNKEISHAAKTLGRIKSKKKCEASKRNGKLGGRPRKRKVVTSTCEGNEASV